MSGGDVIDVPDIGGTSGGPGGPGGGDVSSAAPSVAQRIAIFSDETGDAIEDGGLTIEDLLAAASVAPPAAVAQNSFLVSGGALIWVTAYTFRVSAAQYYLGGVLVSSAEQSVTLSDAHGSLDRIDVIAVDATGTVVAITGTAAAQPSEPDIDPETQLKLGVVLVNAASAQPAGVATTMVYAEQAGGPSEWVWASSGVGWTLGSLTSPRTGSKSIEGTNVAKSAYAEATLASASIDLASMVSLVLYIKSKSNWPANRGLKFQWYASGVAVGAGLTLSDGAWGFNSSNTAAYQLIVLPIAQFAVPGGTAVTALRVVDTNGAIGFWLDDISIQTGVPNDVASNGLTQQQADARYVMAPLTHRVTMTVNGSGAVITAGIKQSFQLDFTGTIIGWSVQSDVAGSVSIDVCKKAGTETVPAIPNTTTDKISASAPIVLSSAQAAAVGSSGVSTWTRTVNRWDSLLFTVTGTPTAVTRVTVILRIQEAG